MKGNDAPKYSYRHLLTHEGRQGYDMRRQELLAKRQLMIDRLHDSKQQQTAASLDMTEELKLLHNVNLEIEQLESILLHSAIRSDSPTTT